MFLYPTKKSTTNARDIFLLKKNQIIGKGKNATAIKGKPIARNVRGQNWYGGIYGVKQLTT
jgi:hypothetical protein